MLIVVVIISSWNKLVLRDNYARFDEQASTLSVSLSMADWSCNIWPGCGLIGFCMTLIFCICVSLQILLSIPTSLLRSAFFNQFESIWLAVYQAIDDRGYFCTKCVALSCDRVLFSMHILLKMFVSVSFSDLPVLSKMVFLSLLYVLASRTFFNKSRISFAIYVINFSIQELYFV